MWQFLTMWQFPTTRLRLVIPLALTMCIGCGSNDGPARVPVHGSVTVNGSSLEAGAIRFIPTNGTSGPAAVGQIQHGEFHLPRAQGPILGTHRIEIEATEYLGFAIDDEQAFVQHIEKGNRRALKNPIPEKYNKCSTITVEVTADEEAQFDFPLEVAQGR